MLFQKHYLEVMAKFRKFQRPVDFEPKLTHIKRILDEIEERLHLTEIRSDEPENLQEQLDTCMVRIGVVGEALPKMLVCIVCHGKSNLFDQVSCVGKIRYYCDSGMLKM